MEEDYFVKNERQIIELLNRLISHHCILTAHFGQQRQAFLTALIKIDQRNKTLLLDQAPTDELNEQLLSAESSYFVTNLDGVKVAFQGKSIKKTRDEGHAVLAMPLPDQLYWPQRRQYYRVKVPLSHSESYCQMEFVSKDADCLELIETHRFKLLDIGLCGFSVLNPDHDLQERLMTETGALSCTLNLNDDVNTQATLEFVIKYGIDIKTSVTQMEHRIGCLFTELPTNFESRLQLYMRDIERMQKNIDA